MIIEIKKISDLKPAPYNPRQSTEKGDAMQKSRITGMKTGSENRITASFELK